MYPQIPIRDNQSAYNINPEVRLGALFKTGSVFILLLVPGTFESIYAIPF